MTSLAFILGVLPLTVATGAGAEMRQSLGVAVFYGMLGVTLFGLLFTPVFYVVARAWRAAAAHGKPGLDARPGVEWPAGAWDGAERAGPPWASSNAGDARRPYPSSGHEPATADTRGSSRLICRATIPATRAVVRPRPPSGYRPAGCAFGPKLEFGAFGWAKGTRPWAWSGPYPCLKRTKSIAPVATAAR